MSENMSNLNDFLEMEENGNESFADFPFGAPAPQPQTVVQNVPAQSPAPVAQPVAQPTVMQMPQQTAPTVQPAVVPPQQPVQQAPQVQPPVQTEAPAPAVPQGTASLFEAAVAQTPIAAQTVIQAPVVKTPVAPAPAVNPPAEAPIQQTIAEAADPFTAALASAKAQTESRLVESCVNREAIFSYGKAKEPITDREFTFEDLREKYESDFPELADSKRVEWSVTYGKESKTIKTPGSDKIYEIKAEIEKSKKFLDGIKKAKTDADRNPECIVKPRINAQSKGEVIPLSSYKEFCSTLADARKSDKAIVLLPSSDGRLYQMRKTPVGTFTAQAGNLPEFPDVVPGFQMTVPKIPMSLLLFIWDFFAGLSERYTLEALVHILYDTKRNKYTVRIPKQKLTHTSVDSVMEEDYPEHMIHVMDIHSHNVMPAKFSTVDDEDEKPTRLYAVMGRLDKVLPDITVRASCGGKFIPVEPADVFDIKSTSFPHPKIWDEKIELPKPEDVLALPAPKPKPQYRFWRMGAKV